VRVPVCTFTASHSLAQIYPAASVSPAVIGRLTYSKLPGRPPARDTEGDLLVRLALVEMIADSNEFPMDLGGESVPKFRVSRRAFTTTLPQPPIPLCPSVALLETPVLMRAPFCRSLSRNVSTCL
jgi:hypothetical protein